MIAQTAQETITVPQESVTVVQEETAMDTKSKRTKAKKGEITVMEMTPELVTDTSRIVRLRADQLEIVHDDNARSYTNLDLREMEDQLLNAGMQLQPIGVRPKNENGLYRVVWGFRRAAALVKIQKEGVSNDHPLYFVNAVIYQGTDKDYLTANMEENVHRKPLSPTETAAWAQRQVDEFGMKKKDLAKSLNMTPGYLSQLLALLSLPAEVQRIIGTKLAVSTGYELSQLEGKAREKAISQALNTVESSGKATRADVRKVNREAADKDEKDEAPAKTAKKDRTYKELKVHLGNLMEKLQSEDGGYTEGDKNWEPPKGYQILEAILDFANGKRGAQKKLWDLVSEV